MKTFAALALFLVTSTGFVPQLRAQELSPSSVTLPGFRIDGTVIGKFDELEYDNTCADACSIRNQSKGDCKAAQPGEDGQGCRLYGSGFQLVADPDGRASILTKVDLASLRHDRAAELSFLHPDIYARADAFWINLPVADGLAEEVMPGVREAAREKDLVALEYLTGIATSLGRQQAYVWWEAAKAVIETTAATSVEDPLALAGYHELAVSLATNAYLVAQIPEERQIALAHLADALAAAGDPASASSVGRYRLGLAEDPVFQASVESWESAARDQAAALDEGTPVSRKIGNWDVVCDNALSCVATTYSPVEKYPLVRIDLIRDAGPAAAPHIAFRLWGQGLSDHIMDGPQGNFHFDGVEDSAALLSGLSYHPGSDDRLFMSPSDRVAPILAALKASDEVFVRSPRDNSLLTSFPVGGIADVLEFFDDIQQRKGSQSALSATGPAGASMVPPPPRLPLVEAAMVEGTRIAGPVPTRVIDAWKDACDEWDVAIEHGAPDATGYQLGDGLDFWTMSCVMSPNNTGVFGFFDKDGKVRQAQFPGPGTEAVAPSDAMIWNPTVGRQINTLTIEPVDDSFPGLNPFLLYSHNLGRDIGDCGVNATYVFDGEDFRLFDQSRMDSCAGWTWLWSMVWRSAEFADRRNESETEAEGAENIQADASGGMTGEEDTDEAYQLSTIRISGVYQSCIQEADSQGDDFAIACSAEETKRFDVRLNAAYKALMGQLDDAAKARLKTAQRDWLKSRDATCAMPAAFIADHGMDAGTGKARAAGCMAYETGLRVEFLERLAAISPEIGPDDRNTSKLIETSFPHGYIDCLANNAGEAAASDCAGPVMTDADALLSKARDSLAGRMGKPGKTAIAGSAALWTKANAGGCALVGTVQSGGNVDYAAQLSNHCLIRETLIRTERLESFGVGFD